jgi:hypothetical protein
MLIRRISGLEQLVQLETLQKLFTFFKCLALDILDALIAKPNRV